MAISKNLTIDTCIEKLTNAAQDYDRYFCKKYFLIIFKVAGQFQSKVVYFDDTNFLHLTGLETNLRPRVFYQACIAKRIAKHNIVWDRTGKVQQKFAVLPFLRNLFYSHCMIGDFNNNGDRLRVDYLIGDTKNVLSLGFVRVARSADRPKTLLKRSVKEVTNPSLKVYAVFSRTRNERYFSNNIYCARDFSIDELNDTEIFRRYLQNEPSQS